METTETYWPDDSDNSFDVVLIEVIADHVDRSPDALPPLYDVIDPEVVTGIIQAETRTNLDFDVNIPGVGMGVDGEPATSVTVIVEIGPDDPVHITVADESRDLGGVGAAPHIW